MLLLDEPLSALDKKLRESTRFELVNIQEKLGITFIMVTHDQEEAMTMSTRIAVMSEGRIVQVGSPSDIYERPGNRFVADFVGSANLFDAVLVADAGGLATLRCESLSSLLLAPSIGAPIGSALAVCIRPERVSLAPAGALIPAQNSFEGRVASIAFMGDRRIYQIETQGGGGTGLIKVTEPNTAGAAPFVRGQKVDIGWNATASLLLTP
jgi:putrescine transport system ATP-binding protein